MKAISLSRPWPYTFLHLGKPIENRTFAGRMPPICGHRGPLLLHAAQSWDRDAAQWMRTRGLIRSDQMEMMLDRKQHRPGGIFARCRAVGHIEPWDCGACGGSKGGWADCSECTGTFDMEFSESNDLRWWMGGYALVLADVEPTPFVSCRGALGVWTVPDEVAQQCAALAA